jgi:acyl carrier protein
MVRNSVLSYIGKTERTDASRDEIDSLLDAKLDSTKIGVHTRTVSQIIGEEHIGVVDLLKIDVENSEYFVLEGIGEADWRKIRNVIIEVHDIEGRLDRIVSLLEKRGYSVIVEKEKMLSDDDILYNVFALESKDMGRDNDYGEKIRERALGWIHPMEFINRIRNQATDLLPSYMLPSEIVLLDEFPLTVNGKVDQSKLRGLSSNDLLENEYAPPTDETEIRLAETWMQLLELPRVGIDDDFFQSGGHSLLAIRLISKIRKTFDVEVPIRIVFQLSTVRSMAKYIRVNQNDLSFESGDYKTVDL